MAEQRKRRPARDRRAVIIDELASLVADAARVVAAHADDIAEWLNTRAQRNEQGESNG